MIPGISKDNGVVLDTSGDRPTIVDLSDVTHEVSLLKNWSISTIVSLGTISLEIIPLVQPLCVL